MKKLLIIGYVWPEPNSSAAGSRMLDLIQLFQADNWQITFASAAALSPHRFDLQQLDIDEKIIELNSSSFDVFIDELRPQAVLFDRFFTEEQFGWRVEKVCPQAVKILDTEDLHNLRNTRHRILKEKQKLFDREIDKQSIGPVLLEMPDLYHEMLKGGDCLREIAAIYRCDLTLMISTYEMQLLRDYFHIPAQLLFYFPYQSLVGLPHSHNPSFEQRQHFLFAGNFRHAPNWDAVLWLKYILWPAISHQLPDAELHIYGAYPPPKATELHKPAERFYIKGWVDDLITSTQNARVVLAPLRFGAGLKGKLFEAMKCCTPSVTTSIGAEGIADEKNLPGLIADNTDEFIHAAVSLYTDSSTWYEYQNKSVPLLTSFLSDLPQKLLALVDVMQEDLENYRAKNLTGQLLRHESLRSHKYMSLWIEEKNKEDFPRYC